jgi:hypothetical protein
MYLKIKGRNKELFQKNVECVMNVFTVVAGRGKLPSQYDIENAERLGDYWFEFVKDDKFEILGSLNDNKAFVKERGENYIVVDFHCRYNNKIKVEALYNLIDVFFADDQIDFIHEY